MKVKVKHFEKDGGILRGWNIKGEPSDKGACKYYIVVSNSGLPP